MDYYLNGEYQGTHRGTFLHGEISKGVYGFKRYSGESLLTLLGRIEDLQTQLEIEKKKK